MCGAGACVVASPPTSHNLTELRSGNGQVTTLVAPYPDATARCHASYCRPELHDIVGLHATVAEISCKCTTSMYPLVRGYSSHGFHESFTGTWIPFTSLRLLSKLLKITSMSIAYTNFYILF